MRASISSRLSTFLRKLRSFSNPNNTNLTELGLKIQTALSQQPFRIRHQFIWTVFLTMSDTISSKIFTFPPESPCVLFTICKTLRLTYPLLWKSAPLSTLVQKCLIQYHCTPRTPLLSFLPQA
jgi:hypothetical protein